MNTALVEQLTHHNLTQHQAEIIATLYEARTWVPLEDLIAAAPGSAEGQESRMVQTQVSHIRKKFGSEAVLGLPDLSFTLGAPGVRVCRAALGDMGIEQ